MGDFYLEYDKAYRETNPGPDSPPPSRGALSALESTLGGFLIVGLTAIALGAAITLYERFFSQPLNLP